jgi:hypothetical protein
MLSHVRGVRAKQLVGDAQPRVSKLLQATDAMAPAAAFARRRWSTRVLAEIKLTVDPRFIE